MTDVAKNLVKAFAHSGVHTINGMHDNPLAEHLDRLPSVFSTEVRLIFVTSHFEHITPLYHRPSSLAETPSTHTNQTVCIYTQNGTWQSAR